MKFDKPPIIRWDKIYCNFCSEPTGRKSNCHKRKDIEITKSKKLGAFPLGKINCPFREHNTWRVHINYPTSRPLITKLATVPGINKIEVDSPYSFQVYIAMLADENEVQKQMNIVYKTFIKYLQTLEQSIEQKESSHVDEITLPNQKKFINKGDGNDKVKQSEIILSIANTIKDCKIKFSKRNQ